MSKEEIDKMFEDWFQQEEAGMKRAIPLMYYRGVKSFAKLAFFAGCVAIANAIAKK